MSYYIYALRLKGDPEARYIGLTSKSPEARLAGHLSIAKCMPRKTVFVHWLLDNRDNIEAIKLGHVETLAEARIAERTFIAFSLRFGHRLFNRNHVPTELMLAEYPDEDSWTLEMAA
jgi:hypothetical protein